MRGAAGHLPSTVDLHLHSRASDGDETPAEVADRCASAGIETAALTDHDTLDAVQEFVAAAAARFDVVVACELTTRWRGVEAHCLAYWVPLSGPFRSRIRQVKDAELDWWREWVAGVRRFGIPLEWQQVTDEIGTDRIGFADDYLSVLLSAAGDDPRLRPYADDRERLVAELCAPGRPLHVPPPWTPDLAEAVGWVVDAGGVPVLAHPGRLLDPAAEWEPSLHALRDAGLAGLEVWTTWHTPAESERLAAWCTRSGVVPTAGSDYHGVRVKPWSPAPGLLPATPTDPAATVEALAARARTVPTGTALP